MQVQFENGEDCAKANAFPPLRSPELPFTAAERSSVTILFGGLTWKHERLIQGLLEGAGYRCQRLPETDRAAHDLAQEFCSSGLCNPVYFTVGNLIRYLREQQAAGLSTSEIVERYVYFTAACGGPCRFGMYESEFRSALSAAGYDRFRILSFSQDHGIHASTGHSGLQFSVDFGMNALHAFILGDLLNSAHHRVAPFEVQPGATERAISNMTGAIAGHFKTHRGFELGATLPWLPAARRDSSFYRVPNTIGKVWSHLYGSALTGILPAAANELRSVEVDWLRVKPVVKVIGEFWAQLTESDGNFKMLEFLEREGAEVSIEPISTWVLYMLEQRKANIALREKMARHTAFWKSPWNAICTRAALAGKRAGLSVAARIYRHHFRRLVRLLNIPDRALASQADLSALAAPFYDPFLRGGEGHLEVAKTLYYTRKKLCHMILALKPFGCLPSVQSDAVQASLVERFPAVSFLPIETSAEGEIHAYSRVQMALSEAKTKASLEFEQVLGAAHHSLDDIRAFVSEHPSLRHPLCPVPRAPGVISTAANFVVYVDGLMSSGCPSPARSWNPITRSADAAVSHVPPTGE